MLDLDMLVATLNSLKQFLRLFLDSSIQAFHYIIMFHLTEDKRFKKKNTTKLVDDVH
jgi:hypothetical protein